MAASGAQPTIIEATANQTEALDRAINARLLYFYVLGDVLGSGIYALVGVMGRAGGRGVLDLVRHRGGRRHAHRLCLHRVDH